MGKQPQLAAAFRKLTGVLSWRDGLLLVPLAALLASLPRLRGISCGDDFDFHLISWLEVQRSWSQGVLYPHWAQSPNWGAGEPRFVFYPPLLWVAGALLGYPFSWDWVPAILIFLSLAVAGLATRALARQFLPAPNATLAGILAAVTPYALFTAYQRSALSELTAAAWIPLLLLFAWKKPPEDRRKRLFPIPYSLFPLSLVLAAAWLTNAPAGVMASYLLAFAALSAAILQRKWEPILRAALSAPLGLGLAGFYLVPAAWEQRWIAVQQAIDVGMRIQDSWLFARHADPMMELHDHVLRMASALFVFTAALALFGFFASLTRGNLTREGRYFWLPLASLVPILLLLQLPVSAAAWNALPKLQFLQFPWRWLTVLAVPYAIFLAAATPLGTRRSRTASCAFWSVALLAVIGAAALVFYQYCDADSEIPNQVSAFQIGPGVAGTDEYATIGSDNSTIAASLPDGCLVSDPAQPLGETDTGSESRNSPVWYPEQGSCDDTYTAQLWQTEHKRLQIDADHDGFIVLRLSRYPAWKITVNGSPVASQGNRGDGLIVVPVREGPSILEIHWSATPAVQWGRRLSGFSLAVAILLWLTRFRREKFRANAFRLSS